MAVHVNIDKEGIYFITFTCYQWIPLIDLSDGYGLVYGFFKAMERKGCTMLAYVIMPNHLHLLVHHPGGENLNKLIGSGKRLMAYQIIDRLRKKNAKRLLQALEKAVSKKDRVRGKRHELWQPGFDAKECRTEAFILQKLAYIHENPVRGKWKLAPDFLGYRHSSARFYCSGRQQLYQVRDYRDFVKWDALYE